MQRVLKGALLYLQLLFQNKLYLSQYANYSAHDI